MRASVYLSVCLAQISEAADILQEIAVETIGAMDLKEKSDFLLEQVPCVRVRVGG